MDKEFINNGGHVFLAQSRISMHQFEHLRPFAQIHLQKAYPLHNRLEFEIYISSLVSGLTSLHFIN